MKSKSLFVSLAFLFVAVAMVIAADDPMIGTWNLNEAKSKFSTKAKNTKVTYEVSGDSVKVTVDGVDEGGKATHNEWTGKFDGKEYPVTGGPEKGTRSYKKVNARTVTFVNKADSKVTITGKATVSADGKTRTVDVTTTDEKGKKTKGTFVYDKG